ncbi:hypothetical protein PAPYR_922 [Paratrimastix pyriformis]|uniref:Uncharacterized protein n=1 Tax=Paratrimastix pyriformis TaxID=342808 RepID=A0ABQ8UT43_9EUKA|nr:hypothetical protein PAPYR_922 [Paratrimastix pyriformis]
MTPPGSKKVLVLVLLFLAISFFIFLHSYVAVPRTINEGSTAFATLLSSDDYLSGVAVLGYSLESSFHRPLLKIALVSTDVTQVTSLESYRDCLAYFGRVRPQRFSQTFSHVPSSEPPQVIYLDADMAVMGDISKLLQMNELSAVGDPQKVYFNSGGDQDLLRHFFIERATPTHRLHPIDPSYNVQQHWNWSPTRVKIMHYTGAKKPWNTSSADLEALPQQSQEDDPKSENICVPCFLRWHAMADELMRTAPPDARAVLEQSRKANTR